MMVDWQSMVLCQLLQSALCPVFHTLFLTAKNAYIMILLFNKLNIIEVRKHGVQAFFFINKQRSS